MQGADDPHDHLRNSRVCRSDVERVQLLWRSSSCGVGETGWRVRTRAGQWAVLHAAWLQLPAEAKAHARNQVAVIIEAAAPAEVAPVIMRAYGLTPRERTITGLVCRGLSTSQIAGRMFMSPYAMQDHLKSVFTKTGVRSRRELVATILRQRYLQPASKGQSIGPSGFFRR
jgi:DNA-binding CsgD family transcriptional regulator